MPRRWKRRWKKRLVQAGCYSVILLMALLSIPGCIFIGTLLVHK